MIANSIAFCKVNVSAAKVLLTTIFSFLDCQAKNIYVFHFFSTKTLIHALFISSAFFQLSLSVALLFHRASNIVIIILRHILYVVYLCSCLGLGLFISYLCDLFLIFSLILIVINYIISFKQTYLFFFEHFSQYLLLILDDNVDGENE